MNQSKTNRIGVIVAAHAPLAEALVQAARGILGDESVDGVFALELGMQTSTEEAFDRVAETIKLANEGRGVLVLADLFGGSAANLALAQLGEDRVEVVTGANLAMLLDAVTHRDRGLEVGALAERVARAAQTSVVVASSLLGKSRPAGERPAA